MCCILLQPTSQHQQESTVRPRSDRGGALVVRAARWGALLDLTAVSANSARCATTWRTRCVVDGGPPASRTGVSSPTASATPARGISIRSGDWSWSRSSPTGSRPRFEHRTLNLAPTVRSDNDGRDSPVSANALDRRTIASVNPAAIGRHRGSAARSCRRRCRLIASLHRQPDRLAFSFVLSLPRQPCQLARAVSAA